MAENPGQWGPAVKVIDEVLSGRARVDAFDRATGNIRYGWSLPFEVAQALRDAGFLDDDEVWVDHEG